MAGEQTHSEPVVSLDDRLKQAIDQMNTGQVIPRPDRTRIENDPFAQQVAQSLGHASVEEMLAQSGGHDALLAAAEEHDRALGLGDSSS